MLSELIGQVSKDPFNPELNLKVAAEYDRLDQTASAISFYQRVAEYDNGVLAYNALLKMSECFERQKDREATVMQNALQAVALMPNRPEAYFRVSNLHEKHSRWQECYTWAELGLASYSWNIEPLPVSTGYYGAYVLEFEKAVSGWWLGRKDESEKIFLKLLDEDIAAGYLNAVLNNLSRIGYNGSAVDPLEPVVTNYRKFFGDKAPLVFDIGTRDGEDAKYLAKKLRSSSVYAIDANPIATSTTRAAYPWMNVYECAVSDYDGEAAFQQVNSGDANMDGCSSLYANKIATEPQFKDVVTTIMTKVKRMNTLLQEENLLSAIDIVKVDVEGYTWEVLDGFGERINNVKLFHLETEREKTHDTHMNTDEVAKFMTAKGFVLVDVSYEGSNGLGKGIEDQIWVNPKLATRNVAFFE